MNQILHPSILRALSLELCLDCYIVEHLSDLPLNTLIIKTVSTKCVFPAC